MRRRDRIGRLARSMVLAHRDCDAEREDPSERPGEHCDGRRDVDHGHARRDRLREQTREDRHWKARERGWNHRRLLLFLWLSSVARSLAGRSNRRAMLARWENQRFSAPQCIAGYAVPRIVCVVALTVSDAISGARDPSSFAAAWPVRGRAPARRG